MLRSTISNSINQRYNGTFQRNKVTNIQLVGTKLIKDYIFAKSAST